MKLLPGILILILCVVPARAQNLADHLDATELMIGIRLSELSDVKEGLKGNVRFEKPRTSFGLVVTEVCKGSPADSLNPFDVILTINNKPMKSIKDYEDFRTKLKLNGKYSFTLLRYIRGPRTGAWHKKKFTITPTTLGEFSVASMVPSRDEIRRITFYTNKYDPEVDERTNVGLYISHSDGQKPSPFLRLQYMGDDWLFVSKFIIRIGEKTFNVNPGFSAVKRDNEGGKVWEWYDSPVTGETAKLVQALSKVSKEEVIIRFQGKTKVLDYTTTEQNIECIKVGLLSLKTLEK